jgi:citrate synthase
VPQEAGRPQARGARGGHDLRRGTGIYSGITTFAKGHPGTIADATPSRSRSSPRWRTSPRCSGTHAPVSFPFDDDGPALQGETRGRQCAFTSLAALAANGHSTLGRTDAALHAEAGQLVATVARALGAATRVKEAQTRRSTHGSHKAGDKTHPARS